MTASATFWQAAFSSETDNWSTPMSLVPARTDTEWFHRYCVNEELRFIKGRLKFGGHENTAPFPSVVVVWRPVA